MKPFFVLLFGLSILCLPEQASAQWFCRDGACFRLERRAARVNARYERRASGGSMGGYAASGGSHGGHSASGSGSTGGYSSPSSAPNDAAPASDEPTTDATIPNWQQTSRRVKAKPFIRAARKCVNGRCACKDCKCGPACDCGQVALKELPIWGDEKMVQLPAWNSPQLASI